MNKYTMLLSGIRIRFSVNRQFFPPFWAGRIKKEIKI